MPATKPLLIRSISSPALCGGVETLVFRSLVYMPFSLTAVTLFRLSSRLGFRI